MSLASGSTLNVSSVGAMGYPYAALTFTGNATFQAAGPLSLTQNIVINSGVIATFDVDGRAVELSGTITGGGTLNVIDTSPGGGGSLTIDNSTTFTAVTVAGGTLQIASGATVSAGSVTATAGTLDVEGELDVSTGAALSGSATLTGNGTIVVASGCGLDYGSNVSSTFAGSLDGAGFLDADAGSGAVFVLSGINNYAGGTNIYDGTLEVGSSSAIPSSLPLAMYYAAAFDLNGYEVTVSTLNGGPADFISDGNTATAKGIVNVEGDSNPGDSLFAGTIEDGRQGPVELDLTNAYLTLSGTGNSYSAGTKAYTSQLVLGDGASNGLVTGQIACTDEGGVTFNVIAGSSVTFNGYIQSTDHSNVPVTKEGAARLVLRPAFAASSYYLTTILGGTVLLAGQSASPTVKNRRQLLNRRGGLTLQAA